MHRRHSADPSSLAVPSPCLPLSQKAYGHIVVPMPLPEHLTLSSHAWRALPTHTCREDRHTCLSTKNTHHHPCMTGISLIVPRCSPLRTSPPAVANTHSEDTLQRSAPRPDINCDTCSYSLFCSRPGLNCTDDTNKLKGFNSRWRELG